MDEKISRAHLSLSDLTRTSCVQSIEKSLKKLPGLIPSSINVNLLMSCVIFEFNENLVSIGQIKQAIIDSGYNVEDVKIEKKNNAPPIQQKTITIKYHNIDFDSPQQESGRSIYETVTKLIISDMTCASCINTIQD